MRDILVHAPVSTEDFTDHSIAFNPWNPVVPQKISGIAFGNGPVEIAENQHDMKSRSRGSRDITSERSLTGDIPVTLSSLRMTPSSLSRSSAANTRLVGMPEIAVSSYPLSAKLGALSYSQAITCRSRRARPLLRHR